MPTVLEDYFDFSEPEEIRIQGHRVWLHHVLFDYLGGTTFEKLCENFDTLSKDEILACLLYYHRNKEMLDKYLADLKALFQKQREDSFNKYGDWIGDLRRRKTALDAAKMARDSV